MKNLLIVFILFITVGMAEARAQDVTVVNDTECNLIVRLIAYDNTCTVDWLSNWISIPPGQTVVNNGSTYPISVAYVAESLMQGVNCFDPVLYPSWNSCHGGTNTATDQSCCRNLVLTATFNGPQATPSITITQ